MGGPVQFASIGWSCAAWLSVFGALVGCSRPVEAEVREVDPEDRLLLELGGSHRPLRDALRAVKERRTRSAVRVAPPAGVGSSEPEGDRPGATSARRPRAQQPPAQRHEPARPRVVTLERGQTLYSIAREHLGDVSRVADLLRLNGWTAEQASDLEVGTAVRLPARRLGHGN